MTGFDKTRLQHMELHSEIWQFYSLLMHYAGEIKFTASIPVYSLGIIVWGNKFLTPKIQTVLSSYFREGNDIARSSNRGGR